MTSPVTPDAREMSNLSANAKPVPKPAGVVSAIGPEQATKRGRKLGQVAKAKVTVEPTTRFFAGEMNGDIPKFTREYENETEAKIDTVSSKKYFFAVTVWRTEHEIIGDDIKVVKRPVNSEQQSA